VTFSRTVRIETVVPNRLKIDFQTGKEVITRKDLPLQAALTAQWLHGAKAPNLNFDITVNLDSRKTAFPEFSDFVFDDPSRAQISGEETTVKGQLDQQGKALVKLDLKPSSDAPGSLMASFVTRVFEESGDFSIDTFSQIFILIITTSESKFPVRRRVMVILKLAKTRPPISWWLTPRQTGFGREVKVSLYKIGWRWWWEREGQSLADYMSRPYTRPITSGTVVTENGRASWKFNIKADDWGRYFIRAEDVEGGHSTGMTVYIDWPDWTGRSRAAGGEAAARLVLASDKTSYLVGEKAVIYIPEAVQGRALVSVETGTSVLQKCGL